MIVTQSTQTDQTRDLEEAYSRSLEDESVEWRSEGTLCRKRTRSRAKTSPMALVYSATTAMHQAALSHILQRISRPSSLRQDLGRAQEFFGESLSPYEMAHRGFRDAISALHRVNETLEQEIQRIAHAVHDEAGQLLVAARLAMSGVVRDVSPPLQGRLEEVGTILDQVEQQLRGLSYGSLRPTILDDLGLVPALQFLADGISRRAELSIRVHSSLHGRSAPNIETALYRIVQEALTNTAKHARAKNVEIHLTNVAQALHCLVQDDGVGFDAPHVLSGKHRTGLGLVGIRERLAAVGGTLQVDSTVGRGTELLVRIPVEQ